MIGNTVAAEVVLEGVGKTYGTGTPGVRDLNLHVAGGEFVVLVGPSGCGKSTTLRLIAGLESVSRGILKIGGRVVNGVPTRERDVALMFQNYVLYPHMDVYGNLAFGLKLRRTPPAEIRRRVHSAARVLDIGELLTRRPAELSGGQRQRVAMGRALVREPQVFLMDEPLSNLDAQLRAELRLQVAGLHRRLGTTTVYVTHDQVEAMTLADRVVVMRGGEIVQVGTPAGLYSAPRSAFVARFLGTPPMNVLRARVQGGACVFGETRVVPAGGLAGALRAYAGREVLLGIRPEHLGVVGGGQGGAEGPPTNALCGRVVFVEPQGAHTDLTLDVTGQRVAVRVPGPPRARPGDPLTLALDPADLHAFDPVTEAALGPST